MQLINILSVPVQASSSSSMGPVPWPKYALRRAVPPAREWHGWAAESLQRNNLRSVRSMILIGMEEHKGTYIAGAVNLHYWYCTELFPEWWSFSAVWDCSHYMTHRIPARTHMVLKQANQTTHHVKPCKRSCLWFITTKPYSVDHTHTHTHTHTAHSDIPSS